MPIENVKIRKATTQDIPGVVDVWIESARYHGDLDSRLMLRVEDRRPIIDVHEKQLTAKNTLFLVAVVREQVIGYILARVVQTPPFHFIPKIGFIEGIAVTAAHRRYCVGSRLYEKTLDWFKTKNITRIQTTVATHNPQAQNFWHQKGYTELIQRLSLDLDSLST